MAMTVGTLVGYLRLDDSDFTSKTRAATTTWQRLTSAVTSGGQAVAAGIGVAAAGAATLAVNLARTGVAYNSLQQNSRAALTSIMGSAEAANAQMDKLDDFARNSPFSKSTFITAQQQLLGFGMQAEKVIPTLDAIQQAVAATGGSSQQISELSYVLAQVSAAGKVTATDLMQLGQRGVDAATIVGEQMGVTGAEIRAMITEGTLSAEQFLDMLTTGMSQRFAGATDGIKAQWSGAMDRMKAASRDIGADLMAPFINPQGGGYAVTWGNQVADVLRAVQDKVRSFSTVVEGRLTPTFSRITIGLEEAKAAVAGFDTNRLVAGWDRLKAYAPIVSGLSGAVVGLNASMAAGVPVLGRFVAGVNPLTAGLAALVAASPQARAAVVQFVTALAPAADNLGQAAVAAADLAMELLGDLEPALADVLDAAASLIVAVSPLAPALVDAASGAAPLVGTLADIVSAVAGLPTPVLAAAAAMIALNRALDLRGGLDAVAKAAPRVGTALVDIGLSAAAAAQNGLVSLRNGATASQVALSGLSSAGSAARAGMMSLIGSISPVGVALAGITVAVGLWAAAQASAAQKQAALKQASEELAETLNDTSAAATAATDALIMKNLTASSIGADLEELGLSYEQLAGAIQGVPEDLDAVNAAIEASKTTFEQYSSGQGTVTVEKYSDAALAVAAALGEQTSALDMAKASKERDAAASDRAAQSAENLAAEYQAVKDAADAMAAANMSLSEQFDRQATLLDDAAAAVAQYGAQTADSAGQFSHQTEAGRAYNDILRDMATNYLDIAESQEEAGASGASIRSTMESQRAEFVATAMSMGQTEEQANALADAYGLIPDQVRTDAELNIGAALASKDDLVATINTAEGTVDIDGNKVPGETTLGELVGNIDASDGTVTINGTKAPAEMTLWEYLGVVNNSDGTVSINGDDSKARYTKDQLKISIDRTTGKVTINAVDNASATLTGIKAKLDGVVSKTVTVTVRQVGTIEKADGGYVGPDRRRFAADGLATRQAMFARGGSWITWAEDETQGEWYIPAAWGKRHRSIQILADAANHFGLALVPADQKRYADGGPDATKTNSTVPVLDANAVRAALDGATLHLAAGGRQFEAYVETVADRRLDAAATDLAGRRTR